MRKICFSFFVIAILLAVGISFAQTPREGTSSEGKSTFTNIAVVGLEKDGTDGSRTTGLPGYIEMISAKGERFYLYLGYDGNLRIASDLEIGFLASPALVGWSDASGVIVGNQK